MASCRKPAHIGSDLGKKDTSRQFANTGHAGQDRYQRAKGRAVGLDLLIDLRNGTVQRGDLLQMQPQQEPVMPRHTPRNASLSKAGDALIRLLARPANRSGSLSPAISASIMARPLAPIISEMTELSLMLASSSVF